MIDAVGLSRVALGGLPLVLGWLASIGAYSFVNALRFAAEIERLSGVGRRQGECLGFSKARAVSVAWKRYDGRKGRCAEC